MHDAYVHCGRALAAAGLWDPDSWDGDDVPGVKELADAARADRASRAEDPDTVGPAARV